MQHEATEHAERGHGKEAANLESKVLAKLDEIGAKESDLATFAMKLRESNVNEMRWSMMSITN